jgi:hypothetical protein
MSPLLNYTSEVSVEKTLGEIQGALMRAGARSISMEFDAGGRVEAVAFTVMTTYGLRPFRLPADPKRVLAVLKKETQPRFHTIEQAERVAWRILKDWLESQLALVKIDLVTVDQVMLAFMQVGSGGQTVYEFYRDQQLALTAGDTIEDIE